jgi:hypothetical protein
LDVNLINYVNLNLVLFDWDKRVLFIEIYNGYRKKCKLTEVNY